MTPEQHAAIADLNARTDATRQRLAEYRAARERP
jgi:hypothetical protein